nr:hypothetical protein [Staphylococcus aureus]
DIKPIVANNTKLPLLIALVYIFLIISFQRFAFERLCIQTPTINWLGFYPSYEPLIAQAAYIMVVAILIFKFKK